jgi:hypothetical protein
MQIHAKKAKQYKKNLTSCPHVAALQKQPHEPHKTLNLLGGGRGARESFRKQNQHHIKQLAQISTPKLHRIRSPTLYRLYYNHYILSMQDLSQIMAAHGSRRIARVLMEEEEELMEIDSPQGSAQKRSNGKAKEITKKQSKKKSKNEETAVVTIPEKLASKLWYGFSYMEQLAEEAGQPECMPDGPTEDLVAMGYIQAEAEELEQAIVAFPRVS